jgi:ATP-dependent Clp protease ATP-binding subunit ClpC
VFERYTEPARRSLFFARYEVTQMGGLTIEPEHLLLGIARGDTGAAAQALKQSGLALDTLYVDLAKLMPRAERVTTSIEIPFSAEVMHALNRSATEADSLGHRHIGPEHLLLGLLAYPGPTLSAILTKHGLNAEQLRTTVTTLIESGAAAPAGPPGNAVFVRLELPADRIEHIKRFTQQLAGTDDELEAAVLVNQIHAMLDELKRLFGER